MALYLLVLCGLIAVVLLSPVILGLAAFMAMMRIKRVSAASIERISIERAEFQPEALLRPWILSDVASKHGYTLKVHALKGNKSKVAVFCHGVSWNWMGGIKYMRVFVESGWTVVAYDSRGHGESGGPHPSYGYFEKDDLGAVADWALENFPHDGGFVAHGESLGAATVLQYAPLDGRLDAVIADCPFSSAAAELEHRLSVYVPFAFLRKSVVSIVDFLARKIDHFSLFDASPETAVLRSSLPMLLIHGRADDYVPWEMSVAMTRARKERLPGALTELVLIPEARHAASYRTDPEAYNSAVSSFIDRALALKGNS